MTWFLKRLVLGVQTIACVFVDSNRPVSLAGPGPLSTLRRLCRPVSWMSCLDDSCLSALWSGARL